MEIDDVVDHTIEKAPIYIGIGLALYIGYVIYQNLTGAKVGSGGGGGEASPPCPAGGAGTPAWPGAPAGPTPRAGASPAGAV